METLPDYLEAGLDIVFVGLNPSVPSAMTGHYFANPRNRFWTAFNRSGLVDVELTPQLDYTLIDYGIGLTDVAKRPTSQGSGLSVQDFRQGAPQLKKKLAHYKPLVACFHGTTAYRQYLKHAEGVEAHPGLGIQNLTIGATQVYVTPNPSPANARYSVEDLVGWYVKLGTFRDQLKARAPQV